MRPLLHAVAFVRCAQPLSLVLPLVGGENVHTRPTRLAAHELRQIHIRKVYMSDKQQLLGKVAYAATIR
jgi:hypothetical protein